MILMAICPSSLARGLSAAARAPPTIAAPRFFRPPYRLSSSQLVGDEGWSVPQDKHTRAEMHSEQHADNALEYALSLSTPFLAGICLKIADTFLCTGWVVLSGCARYAG